MSRQSERDRLLDKLVDMIDAHAENWNELCEMQELIKELRGIVNE
jgi:hypothetical protein